MNRVLRVDGYEMFHGSFLVTPVILPDGKRWKEPFRESGDWLHKPKWENDGYDIWYCQTNDGFSRSYTADILSDMKFEEEDC